MVKEHYDKHLGRVYSWMLGDFQEKMSEQRDFFINHGIVSAPDKIAFDLGAGNGIQSVALAHLGFIVKAVDFNKQLLEELNANKQTLPISTFEMDIRTFLYEAEECPELIVCMGDTLTHFKDYAEVKDLIQKMASILPDRGKLIFSFRDLSDERKGGDRFFHLKSDDTRTMSCFLEYFPHHVLVHDLLIEKIAGKWTQAVGSYPKLRIPAPLFKKTLAENSIAILFEEKVSGMTCITGQKIKR